MNCQGVTSLITEHLSGASDSQTATAWEGHTHTCADCAAFLKTYRKTVEVLLALPRKEISSEAQGRVLRCVLSRIGHPFSTG
jgi:hypothetical protein